MLYCRWQLDDPVNKTVIQTLWMLYDNRIHERVELTKNAEKYITDAYDAFLTGKWLNYAIVASGLQGYIINIVVIINLLLKTRWFLYVKGTPLVSDYKETPNGYFDRALIDIDILASEVCI